MASQIQSVLPDVDADPFLEREGAVLRLQRSILGGRFAFRSNSRELLRQVDDAFGGLPLQGMYPGARGFEVELRLGAARPSGLPVAPAVLQQSGAGFLCGVMDAYNHLVLDAATRHGLVVASRDLLRHPYHLRYELIEFAVYTLAARGLRLVPLHGACVGTDGRGVLVLGASGSGKSTTALHGLMAGMELLSEDAVFVEPGGLIAHGVPNFVHLRPDAVDRVDDVRTRDWLSTAPRIRRRSGVEKIEADLRTSGWRTTTLMKVTGVVFVSSRRAPSGQSLLAGLSPEEAATWMERDQPYAAGQPGWSTFMRQIAGVPVHELRRGDHPAASVDALRALLA